MNDASSNWTIAATALVSMEFVVLVGCGDAAFSDALGSSDDFEEWWHCRQLPDICCESGPPERLPMYQDRTGTGGLSENNEGYFNCNATPRCVRKRYEPCEALNFDWNYPSLSDETCHACEDEVDNWFPFESMEDFQQTCERALLFVDEPEFDHPAREHAFEAEQCNTR